MSINANLFLYNRLEKDTNLWKFNIYNSTQNIELKK